MKLQINPKPSQPENLGQEEDPELYDMLLMCVVDAALKLDTDDFSPFSLPPEDRDKLHNYLVRNGSDYDDYEAAVMSASDNEAEEQRLAAILEDTSNMMTTLKDMTPEERAAYIEEKELAADKLFVVAVAMKLANHPRVNFSKDYNPRD